MLQAIKPGVTAAEDLGKPRSCRLKSNGATQTLQRGQQTKKSCGARILSAISRVTSQHGRLLLPC